MRSQSSSGSSSGKVSSGGARAGDGADGCTCRTAPLNEGLGTWVLIGSTALGLSLIA